MDFFDTPAIRYQNFLAFSSPFCWIALLFFLCRYKIFKLLSASDPLPYCLFFRLAVSRFLWSARRHFYRSTVLRLKCCLLNLLKFLSRDFWLLPFRLVIHSTLLYFYILLSYIYVNLIIKLNCWQPVTLLEDVVAAVLVPHQLRTYTRLPAIISVLHFQLLLFVWYAIQENTKWKYKMKIKVNIN